MLNYLLLFPVCPVVLCTKIGVCVLPPYPKNGNYTVLDNTTAQPGDQSQSYVLNVNCAPGFHLVGVDAPTCLDGWSENMPECLPPCKWTSASSLSCGVQEAGQESSCYLEALATSSSKYPQQRIPDGDCGKVPPVADWIVAGGATALREELPWHAGIYSKKFRPYMQICGGSLVSTTVVISAAHCFWDDVQKQLPAENYAVAVGKIYRPWNDAHDARAQKSDGLVAEHNGLGRKTASTVNAVGIMVTEIRMPARFLGSAANFQEDIALLILKTAIQSNDAARPVCLDFDYNFDAIQLKTGSLGKVAGWGLVSEDGKASQILQVAEIPYISIEECVAGADPNFRPFLSGDKICAGYTNGTAVCKGDSGGGLTFLADTSKGPRYYLRGVVSAAPRSDHLCSVYQWATFTHILKHQHFIQKLLV